MNKENLNQFVVESLKPKHINLLRSEENLKYSSKLQTKIISNWLAEIESYFRDFIPQKQSKYLIAKDKSILLGLSTLKPINRKRSCWTLEIEIFDQNLGFYTSTQIRQKMVQFAMNDNNISSWIVKLSSNEKDNLSLMRGLGFQPLKVYERWIFNDKFNPKKIFNQIQNNNTTWQSIDRKNSQLLLRIESAGHSILLRQLLDQSYIDILDRSRKDSGVLVVSRNGQNTAISGILSPIATEKINQFQLIRDLAWDERIQESMQIILYNLALKDSNISIEISSNDEKLAFLLDEVGFIKKDETVLLGKSLWKRRLDTKLSSQNQSWDSLIESISPNQRALPSPSK